MSATISRQTHNRTTRNDAFDRAVIAAVWSKAAVVQGYDPNLLRKDRCGAWIKFADYGNTDSDFGWEIDHDKPVAKGGTDDLANLQPLHWRNNRGKSDEWPSWSCTLTARS